MVVRLSDDLAERLEARAERRAKPLDDLLQEAVSWYLLLDEGLADELEAWQEMRDEALALTEAEPA